jgi:UTP--glucose-1-phosphate uridylyltransferase
LQSCQRLFRSRVAAVSKALIPCGGRGTRMLALTGGAPKELIPVAGVPALEWVARECAASGVEEVLVVTAPGKEEIERRLAPREGRAGLPPRFEFVVQPQARGLADAIRLGRAFADDAALAVALPDNLFLGEVPALAQVIETFARRGMSAVAIAEVDAAEASRRGPTAVYSGRLEGDEYHITAIPNKGAHGATFDLRGARTAFTGVGRYVFTPELWPTIDEVARALPPSAELDDIPVMQRLLARGRLIGRRIRGKLMDIGLPSGYHEADELLRARASARESATRAEAD